LKDIIIIIVVVVVVVVIIICVQVIIVRTNTVAGLSMGAGAQVRAIESCSATLASVGGESPIGTGALHKLDNCLRNWL